MRKYVFLFVAACVVFAILFMNWFNESNHNPFDYARITDVDYRAVVVDEPGGNGKILVTERLTFEIHATSQNNLFWELWRDLSEEYIDGVKVSYRVNSVKQIFADGTEAVYRESPILYWEDEDYINTAGGLGPGRWYHSEGPYNESRRQYECVLFYVDGLYRERVVFEIEYEMYNAALRYNDCSELYITPFSESEIVYLNSFTGQILIPNEIMPSPGNYEAYTYGTNSNQFAFTESAAANPGYHTFAFELDQAQLKFRPYNQYIEFSLISHGADKHSFTRHASDNLYSHDDVLDELRYEQAKYVAMPRLFRSVKLAVLALLSAAAALILVHTLGITQRMKKKHIFYEPTVPMNDYRELPGELDPNFAAALVFCKHKPIKDTQHGYAAVMLSLVRKGYLELEKINAEKDWDFSNVRMVVKYQPNQMQRPAGLKPLTPTEALYYNLILRHTNGFNPPLSVFQQRVAQDYVNTNAFIRNTENAIIHIGVTQGYFQKADYTQPAQQVRKRAKVYGVLAALLATVGNLVSYHTRLDLAFGAFFVLSLGLLASAVYLHKVSPRFVLLTQFGEDEYAKWLGFYHFLNSEAHIRQSTVTDLALLEQYVIYATAFGISKKVNAALNVSAPYVNMSPILHNPYYRSRYFRIHGRSFRSATRTASYRARSAGGFGGFGGYGGGGRGGGGGGGGH